MEKSHMIQILNELSRKTNEEWIASLQERKLAEMQHADRQRDPTTHANMPKDTYEQLHGNKKFQKTVGLSKTAFNSWLREIVPGKTFLDYCCGNGGVTIKAAKFGADLAIGMDLSRVSIQNAIQQAKKHGVSDTTRFLQGDCEQTGLPDNCIDMICCNGVLHHLDLSYALYELRRILKPGGVIFVQEAWDYNPLIKLYRKFTPQMRTKWEKAHILSHVDLRFASRFFDIRNIKYWHFFSIAGSYFPFALNFFDKLDEVFLKIPGVRNMAWQVSFEMHKIK